MKKKILLCSLIAVLLLSSAFILTGCDESISGSVADIKKTQNIANNIQSNQPTPTDINYSLERYNLIKRAYWVNGQREKAMSLPCAIERPIGYVVLLTESGAVVGRFVVDGKVTSLNSYLTPDSEYYEHSSGSSAVYNKWLADVDGSYGANDSGIFFFTTDGQYIEFSGLYLYSDIPFIIENPVINVEDN